jgi:hypothetical protein
MSEDWRQELMTLSAFIDAHVLGPGNVCSILNDIHKTNNQIYTYTYTL